MRIATPLRTLAALAASAALLAVAPVGAQPDPRKVVRTAYPSAESKLDPAAESDEASSSISHAVFDAMLGYDFLARPAKLVGNTAGLPEVTDGGATFTLRIRPGIFFAPDPAFGGKPRELTAHDYVYSIERLLDPKLKSQWLFLVEGKIVGGDAAMQAAKESGRFDYDKPIEGLQALDRYTVRIRLANPDYSFPYVLAMPATSALAREVVERYGQDIAFHPVGTGPFRVAEWVRGSRIVLEANPGYREDVFDGDPGPDAASHAIYARLKGRRLPLVGRVEINIVDEAQPRWLAFLNGEHDYIRPLPEDFANIALPGGKLAPNLAKAGIYVTPDEVAYTTYTTFNTAPTIDGKPNALGGYTPEKVALRRAIAMGFRIGEQIAILDKGQSVRAYSPLPPAVSGYDPAFASPMLDYNPARAKALLDMFGYVDRDGDGYREAPDGSPLSFEHASIPTLRERQRNELWKKSMDAIGIRVTFGKVEKLPELRKQAQLGRVQSFSYGWIADFPDGENFLQLLWKGSIGQVNYAMFDLPEYNALYERLKRMPDFAAAQRRHLAHGEADPRVRAVARGDLQGAERAGAAVAAQLQEAPLRDRALEIPGRRPRSPSGALKALSFAHGRPARRPRREALEPVRHARDGVPRAGARLAAREMDLGVRGAGAAARARSPVRRRRPRRGREALRRRRTCRLRARVRLRVRHPPERGRRADARPHRLGGVQPRGQGHRGGPRRRAAPGREAGRGGAGPRRDLARRRARARRPRDAHGRGAARGGREGLRVPARGLALRLQRLHLLEEGPRERPQGPGPAQLPRAHRHPAGRRRAPGRGAPGQPRSRLGMQPGDVIKKVNGQAIASAGDLARLYQQFATLSLIQADIQRGSAMVRLDYTVNP